MKLHPQDLQKSPTSRLSTPIRRMRPYRELLGLSGAFSRHQLSADYTISIFGFDFRQGQEVFCL